MKIKSIEPTPSPNTMKVLLNEELPSGSRNHYSIDNIDKAPLIIQEILGIEGIKSVYHVADFIAIDRKSNANWQTILLQVRNVFGEEVNDESTNETIIDSHFGEVQVFVQMYHNIPMQLKLIVNGEEQRAALPPFYKEAIMKLTTSASNVVFERQWIDYGIRYGELATIEKEIIDELTAIHTENDIKNIVNEVMKNDESNTEKKEVPKFEPFTADIFEEKDWKKRYARFVKIDPTLEDLPLLEIALKDEHVSIRRLATAYLGMLKSELVLPYLYKALKDKAVGVRRIAGDCLSDLGFEEAMPAMIEALKDPSKLVRWRAAMFLFELGDESAIPALKAALEDPEFEVKLQVQLALHRIENGEEALGSVWKQMTERNKIENDKGETN
ncbi:conserved virulence factor C family protein [Gottfriedia acidiceleris]|uniref:Virulence factor n=1 Tax=Gottfriedia acidiceleris TaxID=371036 RepID=A0ABY4JQE4_9BACI|nr:conserved virulence factor C family protein [Gottfriedia acidiceleris]UPM56059.1 virulence factor [Gottfriedia acidiceleris]